MGTTAPLTNMADDGGTRVLSLSELQEDVPRQSLIPHRPAVLRTAFWEHDQNAYSEGRFVAVMDYEFFHVADIPEGYLLADDPRQNIKVPAHVAYGSLFG